MTKPTMAKISSYIIYYASFANFSLQPDDLRLKLQGQQYTVLITDERDAGEYICRARSKSITVQKSKVIFIGGKGRRNNFQSEILRICF